MDVNFNLEADAPRKVRKLTTFHNNFITYVCDSAIDPKFISQTTQGVRRIITSSVETLVVEKVENTKENQSTVDEYVNN